MIITIVGAGAVGAGTVGAGAVGAGAALRYGSGSATLVISRAFLILSYRSSCATIDQ
jgi:hypothetical protein